MGPEKAVSVFLYSVLTGRRLICCADDAAKTVTMGLTPGQDRVKDCYSVLPCQHWYQLTHEVRACLTFVCTAHAKMIVHIKNPMSTIG